MNSIKIATLFVLALLLVTPVAAAPVAADSVGIEPERAVQSNADGKVIARKVKLLPLQSEAPDSEDEPEDEGQGKIYQEHPVAMWISNRFSVGYDYLMSMHQDEIGWGTIVKAYFIAQTNPAVTGKALITRRQEGEGWGNITRELDTNPGKFAPAWGRDKERNLNAAPKK